MKRIVITGAGGLLGWHAHVRLHAENCAAGFKGDLAPYDIVPLDRAAFNADADLDAALVAADAVLHFAGVNRGTDDEIEQANPAIASRLVAALDRVESTAHVVYANSVHHSSDTPYGRSKRVAGEIVGARGAGFTDLILPHIFGECARPNYNNVTATFIHKIIQGEAVTANPDGRVNLLHAGEAASMAIKAGLVPQAGAIAPKGKPLTVPALLDRLEAFHASYEANIYPDLSDAFDVQLFNTYRAATYPMGWPRELVLNADDRGVLFEAAKSNSGGQTFLSHTKPGVTRGDHFHLNKVERFLVVEGEAIIRIRKVLTDEVWEYRVSGDAPAPVDMPTLHTHSIENVGAGDLLTLFWSNDLFDPQNPDTYADKVIG